MFSSKIKYGENIMAKNLSGKRPCCICHKWFKPDVRQKGRQKTCGRPTCKTEMHRRACEEWNKKNREYFKNDYLGKKLEKVEDNSPENFRPNPATNDHPPPKCLAKPVLPCEILTNEYGTKNMIIIQYVAHQIMHQVYG